MKSCKLQECFQLSMKPSSGASPAGETSGEQWVQALLGQDHLQQVTWDCVQLCSEYLQGWRLHEPSDLPVPVCNHPYS